MDLNHLPLATAFNGTCLTSAPLGQIEGNCITEDFWLIVVTEGNEDETEINEQERPGGENGSGYSAQDTQAVYG